MVSSTQDSVTRSVTIQHPSTVELLRSSAPLPYTINPWDLFISDLVLFLRHAWSLPFIVWPITPCNSGNLDELYPSLPNLFAIAVHLFLSLAQLAFLISIPLCMVFPVPFNIVILYMIVFLITNQILCTVLLNGWQPTLESKADISHFKVSHEDERWIFLNGVAVGQHWLQSNIDRISLTFGRKVLGVHNPTTGIVFDVVQCLLQRDFSYVTEDIRNGYAEVKQALKNPKYKKVIFIIHSQGGIEGGLILDWLFAEFSRELLQKLEVYTFGNAANHFNNPIDLSDADDAAESVSHGSATVPTPPRTIQHMEHYTNDCDFVSRWGVLHFASNDNARGRINKFAGRVFERRGKGHQFNQHYLDTMFPLEKTQRGHQACETNSFMDAEVSIAELPEQTALPPAPQRTRFEDTQEPIKPVTVRNLTLPAEAGSSLLSPITRPSTEKVAHYSRLWQYRNGKSPKD